MSHHLPVYFKLSCEIETIAIAAKTERRQVTYPRSQWTAATTSEVEPMASQTIIMRGLPSYNTALAVASVDFLPGPEQNKTNNVTVSNKSDLIKLCLQSL